MKSRDIKKTREFITAISAVQLILLAIIIFKSVSTLDFLEIKVRWVRIAGFPVYHLIGGTYLLVFVIILIVNALKSKNLINMALFIDTMFLGSLLFFWSAYIDSTLPKNAIGWTVETRLRHDPVWYVLFGVFILVFYLSHEFQRSERPPIKRVAVIIFGIAPAIIAGLASIMDGTNYVTGDNNLSLLVGGSILLLGLIPVGIFGVQTYYNNLTKITNSKLLKPAILQFTAFFGLTEALIIFAVSTVLKSKVEIEFPLVLIIFLSLLVAVYVQNPNYIATLATPLYELLIVNRGGVTVYEHQFHDPHVPEQSIFLKGGIISALSTVLDTFTNTQKGIEGVTLKDRVLLLERITITNQTWIVVLIAKNSCMYIRHSLLMFTQDTKKSLLP